MRREDLADLHAFLAVLEDRSFTRAAARLGVSQSSLSHTIRRLETRLGVRLITRTTRSVAPTQAGERLLNVLRPALELDRRRDRGAGRSAREAGRNDQDQHFRACGACASLACSRKTAPRLSRHPRGTRPRLRLHGHRGRALRRRRAARGGAGQGHDRRQDRPRPPDGGGRFARPISQAGPSRGRRRISRTTAASICASAAETCTPGSSRRTVTSFASGSRGGSCSTMSGWRSARSRRASA